MILFADQDGAYPRVNWEYLFEVMEAMNFNPEFMSLVKTMYSGVTLHFKVNGLIDANSAHTLNGIAQGCPASPCLYLLCIQGLISLLKRDQLRPNGIKGIEVPRKSTSTHHEMASVSCFADDLCIFLKDTNQLPRFKQLLEIYEEGAGALSSWEKTEGMRIGSSIGETTLPKGWKEGEDIVTSSGVIRYLGIYLGTTDEVASKWLQRTTKESRTKQTHGERKECPKQERAGALPFKTMPPYGTTPQ